MPIALKPGFSSDVEADYIAAAGVAVLRLDALRIAAPMDAEASADLAAAIDALSAYDIAGDPLGFAAALGDTWAMLAAAAEGETLFGLLEAEVSAPAADASPLAAGEMACLVGAMCVAALGIAYTASNDAAAVRARLAAAAEIGVAAGYRVDRRVGEWLSGLTLDASAALSSEAATLRPLVRVETGISLPAAVLSWRLYGSLDGMADLIARNRSGMALLMPTQLIAIAPDA